MFALLVDDYDAALTYFTSVIGFSLLEDKDMGNGKRWVVIQSELGLTILLAQAKDGEQKAGIGHQFFGRVGIFYKVNDFDRCYQRMKNAGVEFVEEVRHESYGKVVVFQDYLGNKWDLLENL